MEASVKFNNSKSTIEQYEIKVSDSVVMLKRNCSRMDISFKQVTERMVEFGKQLKDLLEANQSYPKK